jgi:hypothetical protein
LFLAAETTREDTRLAKALEALIFVSVEAFLEM